MPNGRSLRERVQFPTQGWVRCGGDGPTARAVVNRARIGRLADSWNQADNDFVMMALRRTLRRAQKDPGVSGAR